MADALKAVAEAGTQGFHRTLRLGDGFVLGITVAAVAMASIGGSVGALGAWGAVALWAVACIVALVQNHLFAEMASMFPDKPGGITLYAHEAWQRYGKSFGALAAWGYWMGWSLSLAVFGLTIGALVQSEWFPHATWTFSDGAIRVGLPQLIAAGLLLATWALNLLGMRGVLATNYAVLACLVVAFMLFIAGPFAAGDWHASGLHWSIGLAGQSLGGWRLAIVWLWLMGWTVASTELGATFTPEMRDPHRQVPRVLRWTALFVLVVVVLLPLSAAGSIGEKAIAGNPVGFYATEVGTVIGPLGGLVIAVVCAALFISMSVGTADGSRALYGMARDRLTVPFLGVLNRHRMPARAMTLDLVVNLVLVFFVGNVLGVIFASNVGYFIAILFAVTGFILLRRDRPTAARPLRLGGWAIPVAVLLSLYTAVLLLVGAFSPGLAGYGGLKEQLTGLGLLVLGLIGYGITRARDTRSGVSPARPPAPDAVPNSPDRPA
jgi:amino acid transporter